MADFQKERHFGFLFFFFFMTDWLQPPPSVNSGTKGAALHSIWGEGDPSSPAHVCVELRWVANIIVIFPLFFFCG